MISADRRRLRITIAGAARDAKTVGVPLGLIASDLRDLAAVFAKVDPRAVGICHFCGSLITQPEAGMWMAGAKSWPRRDRLYCADSSAGGRHTPEEVMSR